MLQSCLGTMGWAVRSSAPASAGPVLLSLSAHRVMQQKTIDQV
jgi:hypothetical protein